MSGVTVIGLGAVSPAGWGVGRLRQALLGKIQRPPDEIEIPGSERSLPVRRVPKPPERPAAMAHPRLRRASPISHFAVAAAAEALADAATRAGKQPARVGVILCMTSGCVVYTQRFFGEVLRDPATASPLLFPETVFNAPASHTTTVFQLPLLNYTLVGDAGVFLHGLATGAQWLQSERVDACLVVACEEAEWITADVVRHFSPSLVPAEGAGAMVLAPAPANAGEILLEKITRPQSFTNAAEKRAALREIASQLPAAHKDALLCAGLTGVRRVDAAERAAWQQWPGARCELKPLLGEAFSASAAWQCVAAVDALREGRYARAVVSVPGAHREAIGASFMSGGRQPLA